MGKRLYKKKEEAHIQGLCVNCKVNKQKSNGNGTYKPICSPCSKIRHGELPEYKQQKKKYCEECSFVAIHSCQLDVDHKDGDHNNDSPENLRTLCANCHRLKTWKKREFVKRSLRTELELT